MTRHNTYILFLAVGLDCLAADAQENWPQFHGPSSEGDPTAYALLSDRKYRLPTVLPDGKVRARLFTIQKYPYRCRFRLHHELLPSHQIEPARVSNDEVVGGHEVGFTRFEFRVDDLITAGQEHALLLRAVAWAARDVPMRFGELVAK